MGLRLGSELVSGWLVVITRIYTISVVIVTLPYNSGNSGPPGNAKTQHIYIV